MARTLYKFLRPEHAEAMVRSGAVRIGTLFEFRAMEHDRERGDRDEGRLALHSDAGRRVYNSTAELPPALQGMSCGPGGFETIGENGVVLEFNGVDMLIYCMSEVCDPTALREWGGACVCIADPNRFLKALDSAVRSSALDCGLRLGSIQVGSCSYIDRRHNWHGQLPPQWLLKPERYGHQKEVRAAWIVEGHGPLQSLVATSATIAAECVRAKSPRNTECATYHGMQPAARVVRSRRG